MKEIFAQVISRGNYDLTGLLKNIDRYHVEGKLTNAEREELYALARSGAVPQYDCRAEIEALWAAVRALKEGQASGGGMSAGSETADNWPEYVQPTGAHDAYQVGDQVTYKGSRYTCQLPNCVWAPDVYPSGWEEVTDA